MKRVFVVDKAWFDAHAAQLAAFDKALLSLSLREADAIGRGLRKALEEAKAQCIDVDDKAFDGLLAQARAHGRNDVAKILNATHVDAQGTKYLVTWFKDNEAEGLARVSATARECADPRLVILDW